MEDNEEEFVDKTTENVEEQTTEEIVEGEEEAVDLDDEKKDSSEEKKTLTDSEIDKLVNSKVDKILSNKMRRQREKIDREYKEKFSPLMETLKAGMGEEKAGNPETAVKTFTELFAEKGIKVQNSQVNYSEKELKILANAETQEIIEAGYDEITEEIERLSIKGADKMTPKEKLVFQNLRDAKRFEDNKKDLLQIGVKPELLEDSKFKEYAKKFNKDVPIKEIYDLYKKTEEPKAKAKPLGSLKNPNPKEPKTFISETEYDKMTSEERKANREVIRESMLIW